MTSLQKQLAVIAANSTNQLDLKAQKAAHGKSILFEPKVAVSQDFNTLYQICFEGFEELCLQDTRFAAYVGNIFSEQSMTEEREQMTVYQNKELDSVLQSFIGLVSSRLLLKPAQKAMEWLIRRFRVHEYNTEDVLLAFLPYHSTPLFLTLMTILPSRIPPTFRFLQPYIAALANPPVHTIVYTATNTPAFFSAFNGHVIRIARKRNHSSALISFWSSITAQAVEGILSRAQSGIETVRKQRLETALLHILPIVNDALAIKDIDEMVIGTCMVVTILATRVRLEDSVLNALMEAVASSWNRSTIDARLVCLAVVAQERQAAKLSKTVTKKLLAAEDIVERITVISGSYRVDKLHLGLLLRCLERLGKSGGQKELAVVERGLKSGILSEGQTNMVIKALLSAVSERMTETEGKEFSEIPGIREGFATIMSSLAASSSLAILEKAVQRSHMDMSDLELTLQTVLQREPEKMIEDIPEDATRVPGSGDLRNFDAVLASLPAIHPQEFSFVGLSETIIFDKFAEAFVLAISSDIELSRFLDHPSLRRVEAAKGDLTFVTFFIRVWCGYHPQRARVRALRTVTELVSGAESLGLDFHLLAAYLVFALADQSSQVRRAAAECIVAVGKGLETNRSAPTLITWGKNSLYPASSIAEVSLSLSESKDLYQSILLPDLQECVLDGAIALKLLKIALVGSASSKDKQLKISSLGLKSTRRGAILEFLSSHAASTKLLPVQSHLLGILNQLGKTGSDARSKFLLPALKQWLSLSPEKALEECHNQRISLIDVNVPLLQCITNRDEESMSFLSQLLSGANSFNRTDMIKPACERLSQIWPTTPASSCSKLLGEILDTALSSSPEAIKNSYRDEAMAFLRSLPFTSRDLVFLVESLPEALHMPQGPATKRRRTSRSEMVKFELNPRETVETLQRYTLVLELVESSSPGKHPDLLKGLFHVLGELQNFTAQTDSSLHYLRSLTINSLLAIVDKLKDTKEVPADRSIIRTDLIVDSIRNTSNPQLQNASLLLISCLATWLPDIVLHSVMPIFTFMGNTILRQGDDYSAHVIDQTVSRVVPPLVASLKKRSRQVVTGVTDLLLSFTAAFEHIPSHRRLGLFEHVVKMLGAEECLFAVVAMIVDRYPTDIRARHFVADLMNLFGPDIELKVLNQIVDLIADISRPRRGLSEVILNLKEKQADQVSAITENLLDALRELLNGTLLRSRIVKSFHHTHSLSETQQSSFSELMKSSIRLTQQLKDSSCSGSASKVLSSVFGILPTVDLVQCADLLLDHSSDDIRDVVIQSIGSQVRRVKQGDSISTAALLNFIPRVTSIIDSEKDALQKYSAIACIDHISERFGKKEPGKILPATTVIAGERGLGSSNIRLQVISLLTLASMVDVLRDDMIPLVPQILAQSFTLLKGSIDSEKPDLSLHNACFALINSIFERLPYILTEDHLDGALRLAQYSTTRSVDGGSHSREQFYEVLSLKVNSTETFAAIERNYKWIRSEQGFEALVEYYELAKTSIEQHPKSQVLKGSSVLFRFLIEAFDLRYLVETENTTVEVSSSEVGQLEDLVIDVTMSLVLKLNDATFRPFFIQLVDWASFKPKKGYTGPMPRAVTLFRFLKALCQRLKSLVTSYMSYVLELASLLLQQHSEGSSSNLMLSSILDALEMSFEYDQDEFWQSPTHFSAVASPLLLQLGRTNGNVIVEHAIRAIAALASTVSSQDHYKTMNGEMLKLMRSGSSTTRLAAVKCEKSLTDRLGEDWLVLLPEMLPFITELLEDDDEQVERETRAWIRSVEEILGESLEGMLQ